MKQPRICQKCDHKNPQAIFTDIESCPECGAIYSRVEAAIREGRAVRKVNQLKTDPPAELIIPPSTSNTNEVIQIFGAGIIVALIAWYFFGAGAGEQKSSPISMQSIENKVAEDSVQQYGIAKRNGTAIDACVAAGFVLAAYLQAKNESMYQQWKTTEEFDCKVAGVSR